MSPGDRETIAVRPHYQALVTTPSAAGTIKSQRRVGTRKAVISLSVFTCTHVRIGTVRMFLVFFFRRRSLFFPDFFCDFVGLRGFRVCMYACAHMFPHYFIIPATQVRRSGLF
jgi:hypothetical protein